MSKIPKTIHYCWFGGAEKPKLAQECIASWKQYAPGFELVEWNETNFDVEQFRYTREAWNEGKYAFVSDMARFFILYEHGGIYLDTDVELRAPLDPFLGNTVFLGYDRNEKVNPGLIMGSVPKNDWIKKMLNEYEERSFLLPNRRPDLTTIVTYTSNLLEKNGVVLDGSFSTQNGLTLYPAEFFDPKDFESEKLYLTEKTVSIHHYAASWKTDADWMLFRIGKVLKSFLGERVYQKLASLKHRLYG